MGFANVTIPITTVLTRMIALKGSFRYGSGVYEMAISLVSRGVIDLKPLVTHQYDFNRAKEAFDAMSKNEGYDGKAPIKVMIHGA